MRGAFLVLVALLMVSVYVAALAPSPAWASAGPAGIMAGPDASGATIPQSGRTTPATVGLIIALVTACAALMVWLRYRQRQAQARRIVQEKATEIRQLAEKSNYELHVKDLAEALGISRSQAEDVIKLMGAHLLSTRTGGGLYQLPHIVEKPREYESPDLGIPEPGPALGRAPASGPAERPRAARDRGTKKPGPSGPA
ncbi:MAG: hypothetical protein HYY01_01420 [Chloroflexi bacterium]|nr:hypothetical protein [Chloroflexota bacterium]